MRQKDYVLPQDEIYLLAKFDQTDRGLGLKREQTKRATFVLFRGQIINCNHSPCHEKKNKGIFIGRKLDG